MNPKDFERYLLDPWINMTVSLDGVDSRFNPNTANEVDSDFADRWEVLHDMYRDFLVDFSTHLGIEVDI